MRAFRHSLWLLVLAMASACPAAAGPDRVPKGTAQPAAPAGAPPRMLLGAGEMARLRAAIKTKGTGANLSWLLCKSAETGRDTSGGYQGKRFAAIASACGLAYQLTGDAAVAKTGLLYLSALLDDYKRVGDRGGGKDVVRRDSGYAMRFFATYAALAFNWLEHAPGMSDDLRARARERFVQWATYYRKDGYLRDSPGANYHAGYAVALAFIAAALQSSNSDEAKEIWAFATGELYGKDISAAIAKGGVLAGGDWPEGWQYGSLSVAHYALGFRALRGGGATLPATDTWAKALLTRYVHGLLPSRREMAIGGDTGAKTAHLDPNARILFAIALAGDDATRHAAIAELKRMKGVTDDLPVIQALAETTADAGTAPNPRSDTFYLSAGTERVYARTTWNVDAAWLSTQCAPRVIPDHQHMSAGNFELTLGGDHLIVDPSPYGSLSSLTSNAPTIDIDTLPEKYRPSQAAWGKSTGFTAATAFRRTSGGQIVVARCDYADQFRYKAQPAALDRAMRTLVMIPASGSRAGATVVVWDEALARGAPSFEVRFRSPGRLKQSGKSVSASVGDSALRIARVAAAAGKAAVSDLPTKEKCSKGPRGGCRGARVPGTEYRFTSTASGLPLVHVLSALPKDGASPAAGLWKTTAGHDSLQLKSEKLAVVQAKAGSAAPISVTPNTTVVLLDAAALDASSLKRVGNGCELSPKTGSPGSVAVIEIDGRCSVGGSTAPVQRKPADNPADEVRAKAAGKNKKKREASLCSASGSPAAGSTTLVVVLLVLALRRRGAARS